jgi:hypothetical protein
MATRPGTTYTAHPGGRVRIDVSKQMVAVIDMLAERKGISRNAAAAEAVLTGLAALGLGDELEKRGLVALTLLSEGELMAS